MIVSFIKDILPWVAPPIIGAIIGFVTNDIAIRMLFRPLREVRVLGIRLPFTPGIFPKERHSLSRSIGRMVSRELITEEAVRTQIRAEQTMVQLGASVSALSAQILATPLSGLSGSLSPLLAASLEDVLKGIIDGFFKSPSVARTVKDLLGRAVSSISAMKAKDLTDRLELRAFLRDALLPRLADAEIRGSLSRSLGSAVGGRASDLLSDRVIDAIVAPLSVMADPISERLMEWLRSSGMQTELTRHGRRLLSGILEKLNVFQRFILTAGQFNRKLDERMPEIVDDTLAELELLIRDGTNRDRLVSIAAGALRDWRDTPVNAAAGGREKGLGGTVASIIDGLFSGLEDAAQREKTALFIETALTGDGSATVGEIAKKLSGMGDEEIVEELTSRALTFITKKETADIVTRELLGFASRFLSENAETPMGTLLRMDAGRKERLDVFLTARLIDLIDSKLPEILRGIDVEGLVVQKIDALDVKDVEKLLIQVIASHLRWIDVFGAVLGFLIGLVQVVLRIFHLS